MSRKEEFTSSNGSTICLGRYKHRDGGHAGEQNMLVHGATASTTLEAKFASGLEHTKFGKGFARRQQAAIQNPLSDHQARAIESYQHQKAQRMEKTAEVRSQAIGSRNNANGYDIISGQAKGTPSGRSQGGIKCHIPALGPEAPARGQATLRESDGRFFMPHANGMRHEYRQNVLYNDGLLCQRYTGILDANKRDLPSFGVEDQFSKSQYMQTSAVTQTGLYETRLPGKYTPRKLAGHPSGNEQIVHKWSTDADLNNRALRGIV